MFNRFFFFWRKIIHFIVRLNITNLKMNLVVFSNSTTFCMLLDQKKKKKKKEKEKEKALDHEIKRILYL